MWSKLIAARGDAPAVAHNDQTLTFSELEGRIAEVATNLASQGVAPGATVLLHAPNSIPWLTTFLGALRHGATPVVIAHDVPAKAAADVIARLAPIARLTGRAAALEFANPETSSLALAIPPDSAVVFTSGSTGQAKGVVIGQAHLLANITRNTELFGFVADDVTPMFLPLSAYMNLSIVMACLFAGGKVVLLDGLLDALSAVKQMAAHDATGIHSVPSALRILLRCDFKVHALPRLRYVRIGAGVLNEELAASIRAVFPDKRLVATYGMTELGLLAATRYDGGAIQEGAFDWVAPDVELAVDASTDGEQGELLLSSDALFAGYVRIDGGVFDPLVPPYHTGDLVTVTPSALHLVGRIKNQAKVAGQSVSLDEVQAAALATEGVADGVAIAVPDPTLGEAVCVFVQPGDPATNHDDLTTLVATNLATKIGLPVAPRVHIVAQIPRLASGKVQRDALLELLHD